MNRYYLSSERLTVEVETDRYGVVISAPPIVKKFVGQPLRNLEYWMTQQGGFRKQRV